MADFWSDAFGPTSLTTGVTKERLNAGADYSVTKKAFSLIEIIPEAVSTGALTAGEGLMLRVLTESDSLPSIVPKEFVGQFGMGGLGTFGNAQHPALRAYPMNIALPGATVNIRFSGQAQIANTVAPEMALELTLSEGSPIGPEQFYEAPDNESNTGTAAGESAGNQITINGGYLINGVYVILQPGVVTASESHHGRGVLASANFLNTPSPQRWLAQPIAVALGLAIAVTTPIDAWRKKVSIPIGNTFVADTAYLQDEAQTATGNFIVGVMYLKPEGMSN